MKSSWKKILSFGLLNIVYSHFGLASEEGNLVYDANTNSWSYPYVTIDNSTAYHVSGEVDFAVCLQSSFVVNASHKWVDDSRGICLVTKVTATVATDDGNVEAKPYISSGTSFSHFAVIHRNGGYEVTRVVN
ncbi:hypothetical protein [Vibrio sagamiensis]|uniref:Uncharacterized protein n=1 Tax=Vibrio sagamiensis NBRC 104589 TaxID=1219064 RepID=A0A511QFC2_9VIBR|nr:hypothetical protein [Vibrio sagamiensis]PNQ54557.1 hypothetical protein C1141_15250 [Vibrio agarivorans]GEM75162.1 hypothetical protein VSA01S_12740 [Vibrio sagamiensis NBRC 104589]